MINSFNGVSAAKAQHVHIDNATSEWLLGHPVYIQIGNIFC